GSCADCVATLVLNLCRLVVQACCATRHQASLSPAYDCHRGFVPLITAGLTCPPPAIWNIRVTVYSGVQGLWMNGTLQAAAKSPAGPRLLLHWRRLEKLPLAVSSSLG
ncbi:hypothetical protein BD779DRAFT_1561808, partial [Infundibulicybe gibba]